MIGALARVLAAVLLLACAGTTPVQVIPIPSDLTRWYNGVPRLPTTMHVYIYRMMEECLGMKGEPFELIQWFSADFVLRGDYERLGGVWTREPRRIVLDTRVFNDPVIVSHELAHDLLGGTAVHGTERFERCLIRPLGPTLSPVRP